MSAALVTSLAVVLAAVLGAVPAVSRASVAATAVADAVRAVRSLKADSLAVGAEGLLGRGGLVRRRRGAVYERTTCETGNCRCVFDPEP
ncbi:hypothetical protein [Streptomyces sp. NPDC058108]|uniref:hypothetical protein n=1 Tax=Streptomyces sp. NPDC058108 TaxID=3346344 RepID=UPI0036E15AE4